MARTTINSLGVPAGTITAGDLSYPLTDFSSTGIDDNATSTAITIDSSQNVTVGGNFSATKLTALNGTLELDDNGTHNGIINVPATLVINIDSDNNNAGESFRIAKDRTAFSGGTELFRVEENGNVGIGTASPAQRLDVREQKTGGGVLVQVYNEDNSDTTTQTAGIALGPDTRGATARITAVKENASFATNAGRDVALTFSSVLNNSPTERIRIDSSGNVGIGTTSPSRLLDIQGAGGLATSPSVTATTGTNYVGWRLSNTGGTFWTAIDNSTGSAFSTGTAYARVFWGGGAYPFVFSPNGTERMRLDSSGNLLVGRTGSTTAKLHLEQATSVHMDMNSTGDNRGKIGSKVNDLYIGHSSSVGKIYFKNNCSSDGHPADSGDTKMVIADNGVGIGTTSPAVNLHVNSASDTYFLMSTSNSTADARIQFRNSAGTDVGGLWYATTGNNMLFRTNSTERMRIDSSGNLLVGTTSATGFLNSTSETGVISYQSGALGVSKSSDIAGYFKRLGNDGAIVEFRNSSAAAIANIGVNGGDEPYFARNVGTTSGIKIANGALYPCQSDGTNHDNAQNLGISTARWANLYLSNGVYLGGTGGSNHLDDYEEGTWTPAFGSGTLTVNSATYTKIGRQVTCRFYISGSTACSGDISGLPFTPNGESAGVVGYQTHISGETIGILVQAANVWNFRIGSTQYGLGAGKQARGMFTYFTDS